VITNRHGKDLIMDVKEWAKFQEVMLKYQLNAIRAFLREAGEDVEQEPREKGPSQVSIAYNILKEAKEPLHMSEILKRAKEQFGVDIDRESITSSMIKKIQRGKMFQRTGRNTYTVLEDSPDPGGDD
jgi:hypothetical protein